MALLYTKNTSGAIRRLRRRKPTKQYLAALAKHVKFLRKLGFKVDAKGRIKLDKKVDTKSIHMYHMNQPNEYLFLCLIRWVMVVLNQITLGRLRQVKDLRLPQHTTKDLIRSLQKRISKQQEGRYDVEL